MTPSLIAHGTLTEPVCKTMSGKGREGNKEGKGREVREGFHHIVTLGTREIGQSRAGHPRDVVVSATRLDDRPDLDTIEHLDFEAVIPCECSPEGHECDEVAELILQDTPCTTCGIDDGRWLCSLACWDDMATDDDGRTGVLCICGATFHRDDVLRIIGRLS